MKRNRFAKKNSLFDVDELPKLSKKIYEDKVKRKKPSVIYAAMHPDGPCPRFFAVRKRCTDSYAAKHGLYVVKYVPVIKS